MSELKELFEMVYQWGRVGVVVDENAPAFRESLKDLVRELTSHINMTSEERHELFDKVMQVKLSAPKPSKSGEQDD